MQMGALIRPLHELTLLALLAAFLVMQKGPRFWPLHELAF